MESKVETTKTEHFSWLDVPKAIWYFLDKDKAKFGVFFFILLGIFFYDLVPVYIVGKIVDFFTAYTPGQSLNLFYFYSFFVGSTWILAAIIRNYAKNRIMRIGQHARSNARIWGFERLTEFSLEWHNKENTGNKLQRIFTGSDAIYELMKIIRSRLLKIASSIVGVLAVFVFTDIKFVVLVFIYSAVYLYAEFIISKRIFRLSNEFNTLNQSASGTYMESAGNILSVKALGGESGIVNRVMNREILSRNISIKKLNANSFKWRVLNVISGAAIGVFLLMTGFSVLSSALTLGMVLVFYTYFSKLGESLADMSDLHSDMLDVRSNLAHMMPIFRETEFIKTGNESFPEYWNAIKINNISMDYGSGQHGLKDFSLEIARNSKVGIAGTSGSGKSTLAKIILGLYKIKSGGIHVGERDYYDISHNDMLDHITVVLQETELFNLSLRENITMMRTENSELLNRAVEISELGAVIDRLPEGLDAKIGEKGYMLSGGERQRLGIARAIYKNAPIILLDEATSALDSETEGKIMAKLLGEYGKDKTFVIIAHRLGTLRYTDRIAVVADGSVVEEGNYTELMSKPKSYFSRMNQEKSQNI